MSDDSTLPLQKSMVAAMRAAAAVTAIVADRIYDTPPPGAARPYVSFGPVQVLAEHAQDYHGSDVSVQLDGWSNAADLVEAKQLGAAIRETFDDVALPLDGGQRLVQLTVEQQRYLNDPDGVTRHAVVVLRARTEPTGD